MDLLTLCDELASYCVWLESRITELESAVSNQAAWGEIKESRQNSHDSYQRLLDDRKEFQQEWDRRRNQGKGW